MPSLRASLTLASLLVTGCTTGLPALTQPGPGGVSTSPVQIGATPGQATSHIQRLQAQAGQPAVFDTMPGKQLTVVASAASFSSIPPSFRLIVSSGSDAPAAYRLPYRSDKTAGNQAALAQGHPRHLLDTPAAPVRNLGDHEKFWVNNGASDGPEDVQQSTTLRRISEHAYIYLDDTAKTFTDDQLDQLVHEFETNIYPREAEVFGTPPVPGIDGSDRISIVISPAVDNFGKEKGLMGYFWSRDALPNGAGGEHSNQRYMLFMTDQLFAYPALTSFGTMAHEYQHLLNFTHKALNSNYAVAEETWLDEGMAMYAMEIAGYGLPAGDPLIAKDLNEFEQNPLAYSLTDWDNNPHHFSYGQNYLFVRYLADRYGAQAIKDILASKKTGTECIDELLARRGDSFANFFSAWAITNLVSGTAIAAGTDYNYKGLDIAGNFGGFQLQGMHTTPITSPDASINLRPWGSAYLTYASATEQTWHLNLSDPSATKLMGAAILP